MRNTKIGRLSRRTSGRCDVDPPLTPGDAYHTYPGWVYVTDDQVHDIAPTHPYISDADIIKISAEEA